jgi:hypothetical protein
MRNLHLLLFALIFLAGMGCSGGSKAPVAPDTNPDQASLPIPGNGDYQVLMSGTMNLDDGTITYDEKTASGYLNVTGFVGSNFSYHINGWASPGVLDITLNLNNPTTYTVNDVCIVFENLYGKKVTNADSMMDIYAAYDIDPFIAFRKENPTRTFPPGPDSEQLLLTYPGTAPNVNYFIIAHLGGNTGGVYEIREFLQDQPLPPAGSCNISVKVLDWQNDVSSVVADTRQFSGGLTSLIKSPTANLWTGTINNTLNVPAGTYPMIIMGQSPAVPAYRTYQSFGVVVGGGGSLVCSIHTTPTTPTVVQGNPITFDATSSTGPIVSYEWDFDYDGIFDVDAEGAVVERLICKVGVTTVALQISDAGSGTSLCTVDVTVTADSGTIDGWGTDILVADDTVGPFILNISHRAIRAYEGKLYAVYNSTSESSYNIYFTMSEDNGETWSTAVAVTAYDPSLYALTEYANMWVDGNTDDIYIRFDHDAGTGYESCYVTRSSDEGATWETPVLVSDAPVGTAIQNQGTIVIDDSVSPSRLYVSYYDQADAADLNIKVATTTTDNFSNWTTSQVDDAGVIGSLQPSLFVNPVDHSINVAWCDALYYGGSGAIMFDKSTNQGTTWGTDRYAYYISVDTGPYEPCLAIQPTTGIPGILFRAKDSAAVNCKHYFVKASNMNGTAWGAPVNVSGSGVADCWAGTLDVSADGTWVAVFEQDASASLWNAMFTQSANDGVTWTAPIKVDDNNQIWNVSMAMDECKNVHVMWADYATASYMLYYDQGS